MKARAIAKMSIYGAAALIVLFVASFWIAVELQKRSALKQADRFFAELTSGQWETAADTFSSGRFSDNPQEQSRFRADWIERMRELEQSGFRPVSYQNLSVERDDGCICYGHVFLTFENQGEPVSYQAVLTFGPDYSVQQVCTMHQQGALVETNGWKQAACS